MPSESEVEKGLETYLTAQTVIVYPISTLTVTFFIYGIYSVIFGLSIPVLFRSGNHTHRLHRWCSIALFTLATIFTAVTTWGTTRQALIGFDAAKSRDYAPLIRYSSGDDAGTAWVATVSIISSLMNSIADAMLIHRCYVIFNSNRYILYLLVFTAFVLNAMDFSCMIALTIGYGTSSRQENRTVRLRAQAIVKEVTLAIVVFQMVLTLVTGGRIWWITRKARKYMDGSVSSRYNAVVAIIIESGLLYAGALLATVPLDHVWDPSTGRVTPFNYSVISVLMSGLAPTMVIARVAYGKSIDKVHWHHHNQTVSTFRVADIRPTTDQQISTAGARDDTAAVEDIDLSPLRTLPSNQSTNNGSREEGEASSPKLVDYKQRGLM